MSGEKDWCLHKWTEDEVLQYMFKEMEFLNHEGDWIRGRLIGFNNEDDSHCFYAYGGEDYHRMRPIPEKKRVPLDQEDMREVWEVKSKKVGGIHRISSVYKHEISISDCSEFIGYDKLMENWEWRGLTGDWKGCWKEEES